MTRAELERSQHRIDVGDWTLAAEVIEPPTPALGNVVAGHAMLCNRRTLDRPAGEGLASTLARRGLRVITFDVRGHGESGPSASRGGRWGYHDIVLRDIPGVVRWTHERWPDQPLALLGHSLVGHAGLYWLGQTPDAPVDAVVAFGANSWVRAQEPRRLRWWIKRVVSELWLGAARVKGYFPARSLGMGSDDEALEYVRDLVVTTRSGALRHPDSDADYFSGLARIRPPVLGFVGATDRLLCHPDAGRRFLAPIPHHEVRVVAGADHMQMITSAHAKGTWEATARWLAETLSRAASTR